ncbi:MAG: hypothetical protein B0D96_10520 [Candidatus Sedimenticola endophacoides]|uniref:Protein NosL n=1 Tax=Candidatus Sedimenticola endophacoides TaxID=2548426 RepID=A0A6N4DH74_9GAMM|nr:MAG: hypothetical protein B0D94_10570 [Candidatus Sedimenticola endophacoides]OQX33966.1 MAG: hypothetical protein B0D96_10520 [Candidatus Sedimenticola endophacoides]OQX40923.1 MAG: hypothetical protein B0D89_05970 [Candidatus Sedimenticola endophacoides]PUD99249.1 MAG: hypothetical protein C3L24_11265 [Candidatus Sedimenticola endophacoides]PUE01289.1 MAG: hypothetical protein C3L26_03630 [Candidatus Sedimenticola endophacoides]
MSFLRSLAPAALLLLAACGGDPGSGAVEPRWDRTTCERCRMSVSDPRHTAQVRQPLAGGRSRVVMFDDIGCALLWLDDKLWRDDPRTEIWVTDHRDGRWIDARRASYVTGNNTPMAYGLGAQDEAVDGALDFTQARRHIFETEIRFNTHQAHLKEQLLEQMRAGAATEK